MEPQNRKHYLDIARGIAILFVVMFHVSSNKFICSWFGTFQLFIFFFVSGCLFRNSELKSFLKNKLHHLVIPYFAWGGVTLTYYLLIENRFRQLGLTAKDCLIGLLSGIQSKVDFNTPLWFVPCFLLSSLIYLLLYKALNKLYKKYNSKTAIVYTTMFLLFFICIIAVQICDIHWQIFSIYRVPGFLMAYLCGDIFGRIFTNKLEQRYKWQLVIMGIGLLVFSGVLHNSVHIGVISIATGVMGTMLMSVGIRQFSVLESVGKTSFTIMCIHGPIYRVLAFIAEKVTGQSSEILRKDIFFSICISVVAILICLMGNGIVSTCKKKITNVFNTAKE